MKQTTTINDVAELAGVSTATVGRVVGHYGSVSEKTRRKVLAAVSELNYLPNAIAQGMRKHSTKTIAVVVGSIKNNFFSEIVDSIEKVAKKKGFTVLVCNTHENVGQEIQYLEMLRSKQIDGIIVASAHVAEEGVRPGDRYLYENEIPMVCIDRRIKGIGRDLVESNNLEAAYEAANYLIGLGHERIGVIGTENYITVKERVEGYRKALIEHGIEFRESLITYYNLEQDSRAKKVTEFFDKNPDMTAIIVLNNSLCGKVIVEMRNRGMSFPDDISLIGWDDEEMNRILGITTVVQQVGKIGKLAVERLFELIENPEGCDDVMVRTLKSRLEVRESCREYNNSCRA